MDIFRRSFSVVPVPPTLAEGHAFPSIASDGNNRYLLVFVRFSELDSDECNLSNMTIVAVGSIDGGQTWRPPTGIGFSSTGNQFYPSVSFTGNGFVAVWYLRLLLSVKIVSHTFRC
jgi:hypothetical protein